MKKEQATHSGSFGKSDRSGLTQHSVMQRTAVQVSARL